MDDNDAIFGGRGLTYGEAWAVPCTTCNAPVGTKCGKVIGVPDLDVHSSRLKDGRAKKEES